QIGGHAYFFSTPTRISRVEGPCVLAVDAPWGAGKTTFLKIWSRHLRNSGFPVVRFNAWETDHAGDAFVALVSELTEQLRNHDQEPIKEKVRLAKEAAKNVAVRAIPVVLRILTSGVLNIDPDTEKELGKLIADYAVDGIKEYEKARESIKGFRSRLQGMANTLHSCHSHPLVVMIDELDRCRPSYAIELIEVAKHLFGVDYIIFVLAVNRTQLSHSIKALYGREFDAIGYLRRFIDVDFRLPEPDRVGFVKALLDGVGMTGDTRDIIESFLVLPYFNFRQVGQSIGRLGLVLASYGPKDEPRVGLALGVALIIRTVDMDVYHRFVAGTASDREVIELVFERCEMTTAQKEDHQHRVQFAAFEAIVITAGEEIASGDVIDYDQPMGSKIIGEYRRVASSEESNENRQQAASSYARIVVRMVDEYRGKGRMPLFLGFLKGVDRIELMTRGG
ncbi:MAG: P-loop NTPase fold protein, partial [Spirochaetaceae bacterium]|nr:P-loop NTPase fold protein [Spirochaetaceae bacterium]